MKEMALEQLLPRQAQDLWSVINPPIFGLLWSCRLRLGTEANSPTSDWTAKYPAGLVVMSRWAGRIRRHLCFAISAPSVLRQSKARCGKPVIARLFKLWPG